MPSHKKVPLKSIKTLTFYKDKLTNARRVDPVRELFVAINKSQTFDKVVLTIKRLCHLAQLTCSGSTCKLYQPEVVQCVNMGDDGFGGVQWRCDTDLPSSLRLGKVDVSCEGWTKSGDMNVLQGSCGLTYDLHKVNKGLEYGEDPIRPSRNNSLFDQAFNLLFWLISLIILYSLLRSLIARFFPRYTPPRISRFLPFLGPDGPSGPGGPGGGGGGGPGFNPGSGGSGAPPPPYTKNPPQTQTQGQTQSWGPGFWTGLAAGGLGTYLANQRNTQNVGARNVQPSRIRRFDDDDNDDWYRDVGPSRRRAGGNDEGLGEIRRATGFGGSSTR